MCQAGGKIFQISSFVRSLRLIHAYLRSALSNLASSEGLKNSKNKWNINYDKQD